MGGWRGIGKDGLHWHGTLTADNIGVDLSNFVPYQNATQSVDLGTKSIIAKRGDFREEIYSFNRQTSILADRIIFWIDSNQDLVLENFYDGTNHFSRFTGTHIYPFSDSHTFTFRYFSDIKFGTADLTTTGNITGANLNISNWDTAYGWGNHATAGYLTSYEEEFTNQPNCFMPHEGFGALFGPGGSTSSRFVFANTLTVAPWSWNYSFKIDQVWARCANAAHNSKVRIVIYGSDSLGRPGDLLLVTDEIHFELTNQARSADFDDFQIEAGKVYWMGIWGRDGDNISMVTPHTNYTPSFSSSLSTSGVSTTNQAYQKTQTYHATNSPGDWGTPTGSQHFVAHPCRLLFRVSSEGTS